MSITIVVWDNPASSFIKTKQNKADLEQKCDAIDKDIKETEKNIDEWKEKLEKDTEILGEGIK